MVSEARYCTDTRNMTGIVCRTVGYNLARDAAKTGGAARVSP
jgi:hypothetical protein